MSTNEMSAVNTLLLHDSPSTHTPLGAATVARRGSKALVTFDLVLAYVSSGEEVLLLEMRGAALLVLLEVILHIHSLLRLVLTPVHFALVQHVNLCLEQLSLVGKKQ
jgi:hypothetical protein